MSNRIFHPGEYVIYKNNGVCLMVDRRPISFGAEKKDYYILSPISGGTVYLPVEGPLAEKIKKIPSKEEIDSVIDRTERSDLKWIENSKMRIVSFDKLLASADRVAILWLVKVLSERKRTEGEKNKRLCANEERILATAEKIITEEFSFSLGLKKEEVIPYILHRINRT